MASVCLPRSLAEDTQENIHVAVYDSNTIKVFTKEGVPVWMHGQWSKRFGRNTALSVRNLNNSFGNCMHYIDFRDDSVYVVNSGFDTVLKYSIYVVII